MDVNDVFILGNEYPMLSFGSIPGKLIIPFCTCFIMLSFSSITAGKFIDSYLFSSRDSICKKLLVTPESTTA